MTEPTPNQVELMDELSQLQAQNRARSRRLAQMLRLGSLAVAASFVFMLRGDLRFWMQPARPVSLGGPLEFELAREKSQSYARIFGVPGHSAHNVSGLGRSYRVLGILGTNVAVVQDADLVPREKMPGADVPYEAVGRLVRDDETDLTQVLPLLENAGLVSRQGDGHLWVLYDGVAPRQGWGLPLELLGIALFVAVNFHAARRQVRASEADALSDA